MSSRHPHGYAYDLFISYSTRDVDWVRPFHDDLVAEINRWAKFDVEVFLDKHRLQAGFIWEDKLLASVRDSAILVPVLSPRFFASDYCQMEFDAFVGTYGLRFGSAHRSRIHPVQLLASAPADHMLAKTQAIAFGRTGPNGIPLEFRRDSDDYREALRNLAFLIAQALQELPPKGGGRPTVFLASNFRPESDKLRASLLHHFDVLPEDPSAVLGLSLEELRAVLDRDFDRSFASVHPLDDATLVQPLIDVQLQFAIDRKKPRIAWTRDRRDDLAQAGCELFTSQVEIEDRLRRLIEKPPSAKLQGPQRVVYFLCPDPANKSKAEPLLTELARSGLGIFPCRFDGPAEQAMKTHVRFLNELDGCIIYYGDADRSWFDAVFLRVRKKIRERQIRSVIFDAPPPTEEKREVLRHLGTMVVNSAAAAVNALIEEPA